MKTIKNKKKKLLVFSLVLTIIILSSFNFNVIKGYADDNYSTYLYNQNINVDNDKAHLLSEQSDGSNSYRTIFQSNFLFPAKLQNNMLSTSATSVFSHYSFNQFYFDNLNNDYAYKSNDNSENFIESIVPNDFEVEKGSNIVNGSLEKQDSDFGKYNATYTFDDYQETESNYGNYNATYSFYNETNGLIPSYFTGLESVFGVENEFDNHKKVYAGISNGISTQQSDNSFSQSNGVIEFYFGTNDTTKYSYIWLNYVCRIHFSANTLVFTYNDYTTSNATLVNANEMYHIKVSFDMSIHKLSMWLNGILIVNNENTLGLTQNYCNGLSLRIHAVSGTKGIIDAIGYSWDSNYKEYDNTNPYGLQTELEQDFDIIYYYGNSYQIKYENNIFGNSFKMFDNTLLSVTSLNNYFLQEKGIIEFNINFTNVNKKYYILLIDNSNSHALFLRIENGIIQYLDNSYYTIANLNSNQLYYFKLKFNCNNQWNITIDNSFYGNYNFRGNPIEMSEFKFFTYSIHDDYGMVIDNIDYSWSNGYYENRINDVIPLNDSNYNMYKSSSLNESFNIYANQDIDVNWNKAPITPPFEHYIKIDDYQDTSDAIFTTISNEIEQFGFENKTIEKNIKLIKISIYGAKSLALGANNLRICLFDGINYSEYKIFSFSAFGVIEWIDNYYFVNFNQENINNLEIKILAPTAGSGSNTYIYSLNLTSYYNANEVNLITEKNIEYNENGKPILNTLYYSMTNNINNNFSLSIYNYDLDSYYLIKEYSNNLTFNTYSFIFNESAYFRFNKFKLKIYSFNITNFNFYIDLLCLNITYIFPNSLGYHEIIAYNQRYDDSDVYKGYSRFELQIHNNSIKYQYSEINEYTDDYIYSWSEINTSNIEVENIELQSHVRYGLNTLDIEIINFYYIIYINYDDDLTTTFMEQSRKELDCHKIKSSFNYTSYTRNYLNQTGIIGNYSYNVFKGCRSLYGLTSEVFHRYFNIPYFSNDIEINIPFVVPDDSVSNPAEPTPPSDYYWTYETFKTVFYQDIDMNIGNWSVKFKQMKSEIYEAKHFYYPKSVDKDDFPSFKWTLKFSDAFSYTINFNFLRNMGISILNLILLFGQWVGFMIIASLSYLFMYIGTTILVFIWNTLVYSVFYVLLTIFWYIYEGLYILLDIIWQGLIWVYENLLLPFIEWFWYEAIPWIIDFMIIILAHVITLLIYFITLGNIDYDLVYTNVYTMLRVIADEIIGMIFTFIGNFDYIILFILYYLLLTGLLYLRYIYCKARGFSNRAKQLKASFDVFVLPIVLILDFFNNIKDIKQTINPLS